jgi:hypothetical protein
MKNASKTGNNPEIVLCEKSKRFENIIVCTSKCLDRCVQYKEKINIDLIKNYIINHPEYEMIGVIMPVSKNANEKKMNIKTEKIYWFVTEENQIVEVTESEVIKNPAEYLNKAM